jgi:hypothetical protein
MNLHEFWKFKQFPGIKSDNQIHKMERREPAHASLARGVEVARGHRTCGSCSGVTGGSAPTGKVQRARRPRH